MQFGRNISPLLHLMKLTTGEILIYLWLAEHDFWVKDYTFPGYLSGNTVKAEAAVSVVWSAPQLAGESQLLNVCIESYAKRAKAWEAFFIDWPIIDIKICYDRDSQQTEPDFLLW